MEGDEEKKPPRMSWLVKGGIILFAIIAVTMVGATLNARQKNSQSTTIPSTPTTPIVTLATLDDRVTSMQASLDSLSGRVANLDTRVTDLGASNVTQADITGLRGSIGSLTARVDSMALSLASLNATVANQNSINLGDIEDNISDIQDALASIDARLDALEGFSGGNNSSDISAVIDSGKINITAADTYTLKILDLASNPPLVNVSSATFWGTTPPYNWNTTLYGGSSTCSLIEGVSDAFNVNPGDTTITVGFQLVYDGTLDTTTWNPSVFIK